MSTFKFLTYSNFSATKDNYNLTSIILGHCRYLKVFMWYFKRKFRILYQNKTLEYLPKMHTVKSTKVASTCFLFKHQV